MGLIETLKSALPKSKDLLRRGSLAAAVAIVPLIGPPIYKQEGQRCAPSWYSRIPTDEDQFTLVWGTSTNGIIVAHIVDKPNVVGILIASNARLVGGTLVDIPREGSGHYSVPIYNAQGEVTMYVYVDIATCGPSETYILSQFGIPQRPQLDHIPSELA